MRALVPVVLFCLAACASPLATTSPTTAPSSPTFGPAFVPPLPAASVLPAVPVAASPSPISDTGDCFLVRWEVPDQPWLVEIECGPYRIAFNAAGDVWARREP